MYIYIYVCISIYLENILKMMNNSLVQSELLYGSLLWETDLSEATQIHKKTITIVTSSPSYTEPLFKHTGLLTD